MDTSDRRRKACDLCYTRKLKCNGEQPRCSNCVTYAVDCTHQAQSRKVKNSARRKTGNILKQLDDIQTLQARVKELEAQLAKNSNDGVSDELAQTSGSRTRSMTLPPLQQALPIIEMFLNDLNSILPLFHGPTLLRLVGDCYAQSPRQRDPVAWAAINVVLALAYQQIPGIDADGSCTVEASKYLNKAQSVLSDVMLGETQLLNIQVLVGMVMVLQSSKDNTQGLILIATTIRLAHKIGLQSRAASAYMNAEEQRQHANVFWLAYIMDKDLSLRTQQPSVQLDDDIDLDLPDSMNCAIDQGHDGEGIITSSCGLSKMNYFAARVQLANIEGGVYNNLFSNRAARYNAEEKEEAAKSVIQALGKWREGVPHAFSASSVFSSVGDNPVSVHLFCVMHAISLQCMTMINRAHAWNQQWVNDIRDVSRNGWPLQLPMGWDMLVGEARGLMVLFGHIWATDLWFRSIASCSHVSAMILLMANSLHDIQHEDIELDGQLIQATLEWLTDISKDTPVEDLRILRDKCVEVAEEIQNKRSGISSTEIGYTMT